MFSSGHGFIVDYLAEVLKELRKEDFGNLYKEYFDLDQSITTRDKTAIIKTVSGLIKIIYPDCKFSVQELKPLFDFAIEARKRVKEQLIKMDETFEKVNFQYTDKNSGKLYKIDTLETENTEIAEKINDEETEIINSLSTKVIHIKDNQTGVSFRKLFGDYLVGVKEILIQDPYIRLNHQVERFMELCSLINEKNKISEQIKLHLINYNTGDKQESSNQIFTELAQSLEEINIQFTWEFNASIHDRFIKTDTGWQINLGRGLDIYEKPESKFHISNASEERRKCRECEISYFRV